MLYSADVELLVYKHLIELSPVTLKSEEPGLSVQCTKENFLMVPLLPVSHLDNEESLRAFDSECGLSPSIRAYFF
jgi:hypothetical protein